MESTRRRPPTQPLLALGVTLLSVTVPFSEILLGRRTGMYADVDDAHIPLYRAVWQAIRHGRSPFWTPAVFAGHNLLGAGQSATFYLPNAVFGFLGPVTAFRWWFLFHVWLAAGGAFAWSWHRWRSLPGAAVAGIAYGLNGYLVLHIVHMPLVVTAAWLPFVFLGLDLVIERWTFPRAALLGGALAMLAFAGHPQGLWQALLGVGILGAVQLVRSRRGWMPWLRAGGGVAIGLCLGAIQTLPLYLFSRTSARRSLTPTQAFAYSDEPRHLLTLAFPHLMGGPTGPAWGPAYYELANYAGITMIALAVVGVLALGLDRRAIGPVLLCVFALCTALGGRTPVGHVVYDVVPLADRFRAWSRNLVLFDVAVACLAGAGVRAALAAPRRWRTHLVGAAAGAALAMVLLPAVTDLGGAMLSGSQGVVARWFPVGLLVALAGAVALSAVRHRAGRALLVGICALDMVAFAVTAPWRQDGLPAAQLAEFYRVGPPPFGAPSDQPGGIDRWVTDSMLLRTYSLVKQLQGINGYDPMVQEDLAQTAAGLVDNGRVERDDFWRPGWLNDVLRVTTLIATPSVRVQDPAWSREATVDGAFGRYTRTPRLADAYLVGAVVVAPLADIRARLGAADADFASTAYVEPGPLDQVVSGPPGPAGQVVDGTMRSDGVGRYTVYASRPALFVVSYGWLDGWTASVDGRDAPVVRVDGLVLGVPVPAGRHTVTLRFTPPGWHGGVILFAVGVLGLAGPAAVPGARRWYHRCGSRMVS